MTRPRPATMSLRILPTVSPSSHRLRSVYRAAMTCLVLNALLAEIRALRAAHTAAYDVGFCPASASTNVGSCRGRKRTPAFRASPVRSLLTPTPQFVATEGAVRTGARLRSCPALIASRARDLSVAALRIMPRSETHPSVTRFPSAVTAHTHSATRRHRGCGQDWRTTAVRSRAHSQSSEDLSVAALDVRRSV